MRCCCVTSGDVFFLEDAPADFKASLEEIAYGDWAALNKCRMCGALWAIDAWDKYSEQVVARVSSIDNWGAAAEARRKQLLLQSRGGETNEICIWRDCARRTVKGSAYCIDHLYETGARK